MSKRILLLLLASLFAFCTCKKAEHNVSDYYPQVQTVSLAIQADGSVIVTGQVTKTGDRSIQYAGFCMDTIPVPDMATNQIIADTITNGMFTGRYTAFNTFKKYYFRAWAANENGYALGNVITADSIGFNSSFVPCTMPESKLYLTSPSYTDSQQYITISSLPATFNPTLYAETNTHSLALTFYKYPITGVYKTSSNPSPTEDGYVSVSVDGYPTVSGASVYVKQVSPTAFQITICGVTINMTSESYTLSTKFTSG